MADGQRGERAAEAAEHAADDHFQMDDSGDGHAEEFDADLIVTNRSRETAGERAEIAADEHGGDRAEAERQPVKRATERVAVRRVAEECRRRHREPVGGAK
jgi:hypothetical protein